MTVTDASYFDTGLFLILAYHFIHFFWQSLDKFHEWRIRLTSSAQLIYDGTAKWAGQIQVNDVGSDPRQFSLYRWWLQQEGLSKSTMKLIAPLTAIAEAAEKASAEKSMQESIDLHKMATAANKATSELREQQAQILEFLSSGRLQASLERFDRWFFQFLWSQILRWLILEWGGPLLLAVWALHMVWP